MDRSELYEKIGFPKEAEKIVEKLLSNPGLHQVPHEKWNVDRVECYRELKQKKGALPLAFFVQKALEVYEEYQKQGISNQIFFDTFQDLTIWCKDYYRKHGVYGLEAIEWLGLSIEQKLYRIGRLQFELQKLKEQLLVGEHSLSSGMKVLHLHIPEGKPLELALCKESLWNGI